MISISKMLQHELSSMDNHKYVAHQLAILYQCVAQAGAHMRRFKEDIESKFTAIKAATRVSETSSPRLPRDLRDWLLRTCSGIMREVATMPPSFLKPLQPPIRFLTAPTPPSPAARRPTS